MKNTYKESDMYEPIKKLLTSQGFIVRGEVKDCDIAAIKEGELWIVEMKLAANLTLIYQAIERQTATESVFIAVPRPKNNKNDNFSMLKKLVKKLNLGLITVALDSSLKQAEIIIFPNVKKIKETKKTEEIKKELLSRTTDTTGGTTKKIKNTAYRESCVHVACMLEVKGELSSKSLIELGCSKGTYSILKSNYYNWFVNSSRGIYTLSDIGKSYLEENASTSLVAYYRMKANDLK